MPSYLVESYHSRRDEAELAPASARARDAAETLSRGGIEVRYVRWTFVPEDEICLHLIEAPSLETVREALALAAISYVRIVEAVDRPPPGAAEHDEVLGRVRP